MGWRAMREKGKAREREVGNGRMRKDGEIVKINRLKTSAGAGRDERTR